MSTRTLARVCALPAATAAIALSLVAPASAHVSATVSDASAGAFTVATFSVPHGCEESPTTRIEIQVPESVLSVTPDPQPLLRRDEHDHGARRADHRRPRQRGHRAHVLDHLHRHHPAPRRPARHLRAVLPGARRRGRGARLPDDPDLREGPHRLDRGRRGGAGRRRARAPGSVLRDPARERRGPPRRGRGRRGVADEPDAEARGDDSDGSAALGWAGLVAGLLGLAAGGLALARTRATS